MALFREFVGLDACEENLPDESTILRFRHLRKAQNLSLQILATVNATLAAKGLLLKSGTVVDATLIAAPSSTKNNNADSDLVHTVVGTAANLNDVTHAHALVHGEEAMCLPTRVTRAQASGKRPRASK